MASAARGRPSDFAARAISVTVAISMRMAVISLRFVAADTIKIAPESHDFFPAAFRAGQFTVAKRPETMYSTGMKSAGKYAVALVMAPDMKTARTLARAALRARLIACANLVPRVESHYRWRGKIERSGEVLLVLKTTAARLAMLEKLIVAKHPYDTPEFIVLPVRAGSRKYLAWLAASCG